MINTINIEKIRTIISYFTDRIDNLYITKLMKLFYYIDFISYAERDASITNDLYYKLPYGPVPSFIKNEIDNLAKPIGVESQLLGYFDLKEDNNKNGKVITNKKKGYNIKNLSDYEIDLIDEVIKRIGKKTAKFLTDKTHKEKPYLMTSANSIISYELAKTLGGRAVLRD